jgi:sugar-specific transcriptional regulator TrmB
MDVRHALTELGLSSNEVKIYLTILDLGMAPMSLIARRAGLQRPTTYGVVKKLRKRGLTECFLSKGVRLYSVISPTALYERYAEHLQSLKDALPRLTAAHEKLLFKPRVHLYEGRRELERLYRESFQGKGELLAYLLPEQSSAYFSPAFLEEILAGLHKTPKRRRRIISVDNPVSREHLKGFAKAQNSVRFMKGPSVFSHETIMHEDHVFLFSFHEGFALRMTSADAAQTQAALFGRIWTSL